MMNRYGKLYRYGLLPFSFAFLFACIAIASVLMSIDEDKFVIAFVFLVLGGLFPLSVVCPLLLPVFRRIEARSEAEKYDFCDWKEKDEAEYRYEYAVESNAYEVDSPPFAELQREGKSGTGMFALKQALAEIASEPLKEIPTPNPAPLYPPFFLSDYTENVRYADFSVVRTPQGNGKDIIVVSERQELKFGKDGIAVGGALFPYAEVTAKIETSNPLMLARVFVTLKLNDDLYACILLDKRILHIVKQFRIKIENQDALDYILTDTVGAFRQILKYGKIKKIKTKKYRSVINHGTKNPHYCRKLEDEQHGESGR